MKPVALTVDVEADWGGRSQSVYAIEKSLDRMLGIFEETGAKVTFFISTSIANQTRSQILQILHAGHEIASHGHRHVINYDTLEKDELCEELRQSKSILEDIIGVEVLGFRAPQFRKNQFTEEVLCELGYGYDSSSVMCGLAGRYQARQYEFGNIAEFPVSSAYNFFPCGIKWINLFGCRQYHADRVLTLYTHMFDLLSIKDTVACYRSDIKGKVLLFQLARLGRPIYTLRKWAQESRTLSYYYNERLGRQV